MPSESPDRRIILIAERDQSVRKLQGIFLGRAGFTLQFADDGHEALARARQLVPALVITEILIPKLDGLALCRALREEVETRDIPILVFSILGAAQRAAEAGATAFLRKPLVDSVLVAAVRDLLAAHPRRVLEKQWASK